MFIVEQASQSSPVENASMIKKVDIYDPEQTIENILTLDSLCFLFQFIYYVGLRID